LAYIRVREKEYVKKGDILFTVDPASYKAAVDDAKANVASTLATMEMRESNAARGYKLTRLSISAEEQEDLDLEAKTAQANYQQALAVRENAQVNFDRTVVHAPVMRLGTFKLTHAYESNSSRMALLTWIAVWPTSIFVSQILEPTFLRTVPHVLAAGLAAAVRHSFFCAASIARESHV
jgi:multidrug efflux pump subunit AcrA (membrane-fusion protein)